MGEYLYTKFASSYDLHLHVEKNVPEQTFFNIITHGQFIFLHCYFVCRKIDASYIIIRQLKTAPACANSGGFRGKGNFVLSTVI